MRYFKLTRAARAEASYKWHPWFAWHPVRIGPTTKAWMETVWRRIDLNGLVRYTEYSAFDAANQPPTAGTVIHRQRDWFESERPKGCYQPETVAAGDGDTPPRPPHGHSPTSQVTTEPKDPNDKSNWPPSDED